MTIEEFKELGPGDVVVNKINLLQSYIVHANYGDRATAVRTVDLTNAGEWKLVSKARGGSKMKVSVEIDVSETSCHSGNLDCAFLNRSPSSGIGYCMAYRVRFQAGQDGKFNRCDKCLKSEVKE